MQIDYKVSRAISLTFTEEQYQVLHNVLQKLYGLDLMDEAGLDNDEALFFCSLYENLEYPSNICDKFK